MVLLFAVVSFLGAALLFLIEPMLAKLVLPYFGGSPMVWNTATLVFQLLLLAGYVYTHVTTRHLGPRRQPWVHLLLVVPALLALPIALPDDPAPPIGAEPTVWLLRVILLAIGLPFAILATTGPLLQRWFSWTGHRRSDDPYFLYAASNAGSVIGLLGYPFLVEPLVGLAEQTRWWSWAYVLFAVLVAACGLASASAHRRKPTYDGPPVPNATAFAEDASTAAPVAVDAAPPDGDAARASISGTTALGWLAVAFLPSSLMLGVSTHISTDIAAIPLFWTVRWRSIWRRSWWRSAGPPAGSRGCCQS